MKILYYTSTFYFDSDLPLIKSLVQSGNEVYLVVNIVPNGLNSTFVSINKQHPKEGLFDYSELYYNEFNIYKEYTGVHKIFVINKLTNSLDFNDLKYSFYIKKIIKQYNIDILHFIGFPSIMYIPMLFRSKVKVVATIHDPVPHENEESSKLHFIRKSVLKFIKNIILLNKNQTDAFKEYYNAYDKSIYYSRLGNIEPMQLFGHEVKSEIKTILFYGRISKYKGVDVLLPAFKKIESYFPNVKLIIAGKGNFHFDISPYQNDPQIEFRNKFITLEELGTLIKNCEFSVCPYTSATQSGVVASVLALNKPLIVTNVGGLPSMIEHNKSGLIIEANDINVLSESMTILLKDQEKLNSMCNYIQETSRSGENSWFNISKHYIKIYNTL